MKILIKRDALKRAVSSVVGVVDRKQTMPILGHILLENNNESLKLTATNLEVQISSTANIVETDDFESVAVSGRKFYEITRSLDSKEIELTIAKGQLVIKANDSSYKISTLPGTDFPLFENSDTVEKVKISQEKLLTLFNKTHFSMAQQDVRFYLNGLLLETEPNKIKAIATDGHRLAASETSIEKKQTNKTSSIVPRKAILELIRLLDNKDDVRAEIGSNSIRFTFNDLCFITKLIDGKFPDYNRVIPTNTEINIQLNSLAFKPSLQRVSILANEKFRGIRLETTGDSLELSSENPEQEQANESIPLQEKVKKIVVGFNVGYLIDAVSSCEGNAVCLSLNDENSSALITSPEDKDTKYVVMPMRL
jgi:DNA polymerase-3 subunit beta|tara:strand:- start:2705 stop:3802 length:1098 start_codon:yes stop_codon:yes gene_type:complete